MSKQRPRIATARMLVICATIACSASVASAMWTSADTLWAAQLDENVSPSDVPKTRAADGQVLPTYDWTTTPAKRKHNGSTGAAAAMMTLLFAGYFATLRRSRSCSTHCTIRTMLRRFA